MAKQSAGVLLYRKRGGAIEIFLVHPGGPYWSGKDLGSWSIPKGEFTAEEAPLSAARREFEEETGHEISGDFVPLAPIKQPGGKVVHAFAVEGDCDAQAIESNRFSLEWPPRSGHYREFPEVDRAGWFSVPLAKQKIAKGQIGFIDELLLRIPSVSQPSVPQRETISD